MPDYRPDAAVTRKEFARAWSGVSEMAKELDRMMKVVGRLTTRVEQLDRQVLEMAKIVDEINSKKVDA